MELKTLKDLHDKAFDSSQITRERAADDMVFYFVTQWDDNALSESQLAYRGEFNILKKAGRQIISDLASNPVQIDFEPKEETRDDAAEFADGKYRKDGNHNASLESFENAKQESIVCGVGAWEIYTKYATTRSGNRNQVIRRKPIFEANNNVFWDPNAKYLDKSDAKYVSVLTAYSEEGYKDLVEELTGERPEVTEESFKDPDHSYAFPWVGGEGKKIYVVSFYHRKKIKEKILLMEDPFGQTTELRESSLEKVMDEMLDAGFSIVDEKNVERWQVTKYIASGAEILSETVIAGEHLPIIPCYGEHAYIEGEEHYEGVTRLAKDPQRLRNFQLSYLADIVSRSPRVKPVYYPEQISKFEHMYTESGADNNFPYVLQNSADANGKDLTQIPPKTTPEQPMPSALMASIEVSRQAVEDVANPGIPQDVADPDLSGKAILALQSRLDMQSMVYQEHYKHAKRRDAEIYASMAPEIFDVPRRTKVELPDGTKKDVEVMRAVIDEETGDIVYLNDIRNAEFDVYSKIGPSYSSQKEQTIDRLNEMIAGFDPGDPMRKVLQLKVLMLMDGVEFDDVREHANMQLVLQGIKKPETPEEIAALEQAQAQPEQPDAAMVLAMAEDKKGEADILQEKREGIKMQLDDENKKADQQIEVFKATTERLKVKIEAEKAGAAIKKSNVETIGKQLENEAEAVADDITKKSNEELIQMLMAG